MGADDRVEPAAVHDVGVRRAVAERQDGEAEIGQRKPKHERKQPEGQGNGRKPAHVQASAEHIAAGDKREKSERACRVDQVCSEFRRESRSADERQQDQPSEGDQVQHQQRVGKSAPAIDVETVGNDAGRHHQGETAGVETRDFSAQLAQSITLRHGAVPAPRTCRPANV